MHLLQASPGEMADGAVAVDLRQTPAPLIVISSADTELAALSEARASLGDAAPALRLAQLQWLAHPFSVDQYLEDTARHARLVIVRVLGGAAYWPYGLENFSRALRGAGVGFVALPGDDKPDAALQAASTVSHEDWSALWAYLVEGGPQNAAHFLEYARYLMGQGEKPPAAAPLLRAGVYWPGAAAADLEAAQAQWVEGQPVAALVFYRALLTGAGLQPVNRLVKALAAEGLNPLPIFVASLKEPVSAATLARLFAAAPPDVVLNATAFAAGAPPNAAEPLLRPAEPTPLDAAGRPVLQVVFSSGSEAAWRGSTRGLAARDVAMHVALPEVDGRIFTRAVSFKQEAYRDDAAECAIAAYRAEGGRVAFTAALAAAWARLGRRPAAARRVALVLANYPDKDGRMANGVGLDTPASTAAILSALRGAGYTATGAPETGDAVVAALKAGPTNQDPTRLGGEPLPLEDYCAYYNEIPWEARRLIEERWGAPEADPFCRDGAFFLPVRRFGHIALGLQPARGYNIDPKETYHAPDLPPPHGYLAFYFLLRHRLQVDAIVHVGKHGTLEWLPGKALALSDLCFPEIALGPTPHFYPFIVNDPGEGAQAKRRAGAVIIDHLTPPMTRAETYGPLRELEALLDEYYEADALDPRRRAALARDILFRLRADGLDQDLGIAGEAPEDATLQALDAYLCELKEAQIRDGLHVFGASPVDDQETDLVAALMRLPRGSGEGAHASLLRALSADLALDFDPLDCPMAQPWRGARPEALRRLSDAVWRTAGDTVERLEGLARALIAGSTACALEWVRTKAALDHAVDRVRPAVKASGPWEMDALLGGLEGRFVPPGPSGAPTRGRLDVLPTGRNFYSMDSRSLPTRTAWALGRKSAALLVERHLQDEGDWLRAALITAWGTSNMRTGGDDIAQALALIGAQPVWDAGGARVSGFEITPLAELGRPRVDVTLRVSGFFRDAFPAQMALFDAAARAVMALDEPEDQNPAAARARAERAALAAAGARPEEATRRAGYRVFGSKPGAYGAGLQALIDSKDPAIWAGAADLGEAYLVWGAYAYGAAADEDDAGGGWGAPAREALETRLRAVDAVVQNQDNREHDLLDSDDYYQFEGGASAAVEALTGARPKVYHNDHSRPERPVVRTLDEEIGRVMRSRVVNPKWIAGVMRHGYKGAFEIAATVDYMFAFAAATGAVKSHHFDLAYDAFLGDAETRAFIEAHNPDALREIEARLRDAARRGLWTPRRNSAAAMVGGDQAAPPSAS